MLGWATEGSGRLRLCPLTLGEPRRRGVRKRAYALSAPAKPLVQLLPIRYTPREESFSLSVLLQKEGWVCVIGLPWLIFGDDTKPQSAALPCFEVEEFHLNHHPAS